jgi:putative aldouronate transport system substrate-binding protein
VIRNKKLLALTLTAVITLSVMSTGCSSISVTVSDTTTSAEISKKEDATPKLAPYEITWYFVGRGQQKDVELVQKEVDKYLADKINATVTLNCLDWDTYDRKMKGMIAAGEPFDLCFTAIWLNDYVKNARDGAFVELDDYFNTYLEKTKGLLGDDLLSGSRINGHNYGIPANKEKARDWGFFYNKTLADKYGIDMSNIKSFKDIEPVLQIMKEKEPGVLPLYHMHPATAFISWNAANIKDLGAILPDGKAVNQYETPEFKEAYNLARDFYNKGFYRKDAATMKDGDAIMKSGKFFAYAVNLKPGYTDEFKISAKLAAYETAQCDVTEPVICNADTMGSLQAISTTSKNPDRVAMFLELVNTDRALNNLVNFGIENIHYRKVSDDVIEGIGGSGYDPNMQWMYGNQFLNYLYASEDPSKWEQFEAFNERSKPAPDLGFIFNSDHVMSEREATLKVINDFHTVLQCGAVDPTTALPKFIEELKAAGADRIVAEMQRQFDQWKASKQLR